MKTINLKHTRIQMNSFIDYSSHKEKLGFRLHKCGVYIKDKQLKWYISFSSQEPLGVHTPYTDLTHLIKSFLWGDIGRKTMLEMAQFEVNKMIQTYNYKNA